MAGFLCRCGKILSNTQAPNDIQLRVYTDREWDEIINHEVIDPITMQRPKYDVWRCQKCERVYVFNKDGSVKKVYALEK